jgi:hypothetical protein
MTFSRVASQAPFEAGLGGAFSDHNRQGAWASEQGTNCQSWELAYGESHAMGDSRHQALTTSPSWNSTIVEMTGTTKGGNGADYNSSLPNH